jgi:hypothetical protein
MPMNIMRKARFFIKIWTITDPLIVSRRCWNWRQEKINFDKLVSIVGCTDTKIVSAGENAGGKVALSWNTLPGAISYNIYFFRTAPKGSKPE